MRNMSPAGALRAKHYFTCFVEFWGRRYVAEEPFIMDAAFTILSAGSEYVDKPATVENMVNFFTAVARERWAASTPVDEAITSWSDLLKHESADTRMAITSLMIMVNTIMRNGSMSSAPNMHRAVYGKWTEEMTVWELMCVAPIYI